MIICEWNHVRNILMGKQILIERTPANKKRGRTYLLAYLLPSSNTKLVLIVRTLMSTLSQIFFQAGQRVI